MKNLLVLLFLSLTLNLNAQSYGDYIQKGDELYDAKDYKASAEEYDKAFALEDAQPRPRHLYNAACSWALAGNKEKSFEHLENFIKTGRYNLDWMKNDSDLEPLHKEKKWTVLIQDLEEKIKAEQATWNMAVREELKMIHHEDQYYRKMIDSISKKHDWESPEMKAHWKIINAKDSVNLIKVKKIIAEHGYPGKTLVGRDRMSTAFLVIQHSDLEVQEEYLPLLRAAADADELRWGSLALLIDRIHTRKDEPQIYGSQVRRNPETEKYEFFPIKDPENVNKRRAEVGLRPIEDYGKRWNIEFKVK